MSKPAKKRNKAYQGPKYNLRGANPIRVAINRAAVLTADEKSRLLDPIYDCFDQLRRGELDPVSFKHLADEFNVAEALTMPGFNLLPDHKDKFDAAQDALRAVAERRNAGGSWTCYPQEIAAIDLALEFHGIQLDYVSAGELARATKWVDDILRGAKSGSPGKGHFHTAFRPEDLEKVEA